MNYVTKGSAPIAFVKFASEELATTALEQLRVRARHGVIPIISSRDLKPPPPIFPYA